MDPDETLREIREIIAEADENPERLLEQLPELVDALDGWISKGGFLPREWADAVERGTLQA